MPVPTQKQQTSGAAIIAPLLRKQTGATSPRHAGNQTAYDFVKEHAAVVQEHAAAFAKDPNASEKLRNRLNEESLYLHAEISIMTHALPGEKDALTDLQNATNKMIEAAAEAHQRGVKYVDMNSVKSEDKSTASKHIHGKLFHMDPDSAQSLRSTVEEDVLKKLKKLGYENQEVLFDRIFLIRSLWDEAPATAQVTPSDQLELLPPKEEESAQKRADKLKQQQAELDIIMFSSSLAQSLPASNPNSL